MHKLLSGFAIAAATILFAAPASASLISSTVTGSLVFNGLPNVFTPTTVTITGNNTEFSYQDVANADSADFNGGSLKITDISASTAASAKYVFVDTAFAGLILTETSDNFLNGGAVATLVGTTLTVITPEFRVPGTYSATYSLTAASVPEPTTVALLGLGLLGFAASRRKTAKK